MRRTFLFLSSILFICSCSRSEKNIEISDTEVTIQGAMREVMHKGEIGPKVALANIRGTNQFGLGPLAGLQGELLLWEGTPYVSIPRGENMQVLASRNASAPFFVSAAVNSWDTLKLPSDIQTIKHLENYLNGISSDVLKPFPFILKGEMAYTDIHIQNLPTGTVVSSPEEAHAGQMNFELLDRESDILGFFSREHMGVFTHMGNFTHMHLMTEDRKLMGHLDSLLVGENQINLLLPSS